MFLFFLLPSLFRFNWFLNRSNGLGKKKRDISVSNATLDTVSYKGSGHWNTFRIESSSDYITGLEVQAPFFSSSVWLIPDKDTDFLPGSKTAALYLRTGGFHNKLFITLFRPPADPPFKVARLTQLPHFKGTVHLKISGFFFFLGRGAFSQIQQNRMAGSKNIFSLIIYFEQCLSAENMTRLLKVIHRPCEQFRVGSIITRQLYHCTEGRVPLLVDGSWITELANVKTQPRRRQFMFRSLHLFLEGQPASSYQKAAGSIPLVCVPNCRWARYWTPNSSRCAGRHVGHISRLCFNICKCLTIGYL